VQCYDKQTVGQVVKKLVKLSKLFNVVFKIFVAGKKRINQQMIVKTLQA